MEFRKTIGPITPWIRFQFWHIGIGTSIYANWPWQNHHRDKTYRYIGLNIICPFYLRAGRPKLNSFRFGKHVDHCGRIYVYFAWLVFFQDIWHCRNKNWKESSAKLFVWN